MTPRLAAAHQLPRPRTALIGRAAELNALRVLIDAPNAPLVTIVGPGGVGKTRLAIELAAMLANEGRDVVFVQLADLREPGLAASAIRDALSDETASPGAGQQAFLAGLRQRTTVLVLDNLEQVVGVAPFLAELMEFGPGLRLVATSRLPLRIEGEREFPLRPLAVVDNPAPSEAVALFVARAQAVDPNFVLNEGNAADVAAICRRLDGLPLAIELAAARTKVLAPAAMRVRLEQAPLHLGTGRRDAPARQQTLANAIEWSYRLLDPAERQLLRVLGVFAGSFTLDAAGEVSRAIRDDGLDLDIVDGVATLVDHSLLRRVASQPDDRFAMLQTIRSYAQEELAAEGELERANAEHARVFIDFVRQVEQPNVGAAAPNAVARIHAEIDNIRAALVWTSTQADRGPFVLLVSMLGRYWIARGRLEEEKFWIERAMLDADAAEPATRIRLFDNASWVATFQGEHALADERGKVALALAQEHGDLQLELNAMNGRASAFLHRGDLATAISVWEEASSRARAHEARRTGLLHNLSLAYLLNGNLAKARSTHEEALRLANAAGNSDIVSYTRLLSVEIDIADGRVERARETLNDLAPRLLSGVDQSLAVDVVAVGSSLATTLGDFETGARLTGAYTQRRAAMGFVDPFAATLEREQRASMRAALGEEAMQQAMNEGGALTDDEILAMVRGLGPAERVSERAVDRGLTARELDVLRLLGSGATNQEIADRLFISARTVQTHVANILSKLNVPSRAAAASLAARDGLI